MVFDLIQDAISVGVGATFYKGVDLWIAKVKADAVAAYNAAKADVYKVATKI